MGMHRLLVVGLACAGLWGDSVRAALPPEATPQQVFAIALSNLISIVEPGANATPGVLKANVKVLRASGLPAAVGAEGRLALQAPDKATLSTQWEGKSYAVGRDGQEVWIHVADQKFGVIGRPGERRFKNVPASRDTTELPDLTLPLPKEQLLLMTLLMNVEALPTETNQGVRCRVVRAAPLPEARKMLRLRAFKIEAAVRETDLLPARIGYLDNHDNDILVEVRDPMLAAAAPAGQWKIPAAAGDHVETTALSHLTHFVPVIYATLTKKVPALPPVTGERKVIGTEGQGRLEMLDGVRLLFLKGTPEEMGRQHGTLLEKEIRDLVDHVLYGVGVGSSFAKGRWFFGEIEEAQQHLRPFVAPGYFREMDSLALASGCEKEEVRLANLFPELFHCSGFALFGEATAGGRMYHGRVLDYLRGMGLEQNAVVMVFQPSQGHAWVNIGYAGFVGSVTAMNDQHIAIGEMGGRGEGHWDGKPMAQLMREVMERAGTLDEAVEIMRRGPRTCEYYYVISDGKAKRAVGIAATPDTFEVLQPGQSHPRLPHPFKDAVLMSAGDRYEKLAERVTTGYGKFDAESARALMTRPVAMKSNIHSVLFEPETLDFWVANADSENPASHCRYTHLNLGDLLGRKN